MTIVDLDKLHFPFTTARPEYAQGVQDLHKAILKCKIDAIPVEWLKDIARQGLVFAHCDEREGHIVEHDGIFECVSGALAAQVIQNILALWEAENATR